MKRAPSRMKYLVIEYIPSAMDAERQIPARIDGHYQFRHDAEDVARWWQENPFHPESRIVVVDIVSEAKQPRSWREIGRTG